LVFTAVYIEPHVTAHNPKYTGIPTASVLNAFCFGGGEGGAMESVVSVVSVVLSMESVLLGLCLDWSFWRIELSKVLFRFDEFEVGGLCCWDGGGVLVVSVAVSSVVWFARWGEGVQ
jgi:hypothetical protein